MKRMLMPALVLPVVLLTAQAMPVCAAKDAEQDWQIAYQKVLTTYSRIQGFQGGSTKDDYGSRWDLYDLDGDDSPELFISPDNSHANGVMIYTCWHGEPKLLQYGEYQAFGEFGLTAVNPQEHMLGSFRTGMGIVSQTFYVLEKGTLRELDSFVSDVDSYPPEEQNKAVWQHNGEQVTREAYDAAYAPYKDLVWREDIGRQYAFSDRSPLASAHRTVSAAKPPDMKVALIGGSIAALFVAVAAAIVSVLIRK